MHFPIFMITVVGMGAVSAVAAIAALVMLFKHLSHGQMRAPRRAAFNFDQATAGPAARPPEPRRTPPPPPPGPPLAPPRLSLHLIAPDAPEAILMPLRLVRGRILEVNLPLGLTWTGRHDLEDLLIRVQLPNDITYGASLEHMLHAPLPAQLPVASISYASAQARTTISITAPQAPGGTEASFALPISVTQMSARTHPVLLTVSAAGVEPIVRNYVLELLEDAGDNATEPAPEVPPGVWICRPDDARRERDPHLPLDRIASTTFAITRG